MLPTEKFANRESNIYAFCVRCHTTRYTFEPVQPGTKTYTRFIQTRIFQISEFLANVQNYTRNPNNKGIRVLVKRVYFESYNTTTLLLIVLILSCCWDVG